MSNVYERKREVVYKWGRRGGGDGEFVVPENIAVGAGGLLYITDSGNHRIHCFESDGQFVRAWGGKGKKNGKFAAPLGLAIGIEGSVNESIAQVVYSVLELHGFPPGVAPICLEYVGNEYVYVCDAENYRMQVTTTDGKFVRKWATRYPPYMPSHCAVDNRHGVIYISNYAHLQVYQLNGTLLQNIWYHYTDHDLGFYSQPGSIVVSPKGWLHVIYRSNRFAYTLVSFDTDKISLEDEKDDYGSARAEGRILHTPTKDYYGMTMDNRTGNFYLCNYSHVFVLRANRHATVLPSSSKVKTKAGLMSQIKCGPLSGAGGLAGYGNMLYVVDRNNHSIVAVRI